MVLVTTAVPAGAVITAADLATTTVAAGPGIKSSRAASCSRSSARSPPRRCEPGTLLAASELTTKLSRPAPGQGLVPVPVRPSALPASGLLPGDQVLAVATPGAQGQAGNGRRPRPC